MRASRFALLVAACVVAQLVIAAPAFAAGDLADFDGTYVGSGVTNTGATAGVYIWVQAVSENAVKLTIHVKALPVGVPVTAEADWTGPDSFTMAPSVNITVVKGSGTLKFVRSGGERQVTGGGGGTVNWMDVAGAAKGGDLFRSASGSASGSAERVSTSFVEFVLPDTITTRTAAPSKPATSAAPALRPVSTSTPPIGGTGPEQPPLSEPSQAEGAAGGGLAMVAGLALCAAIGAPMSGEEFLEVWNAPPE